MKFRPIILLIILFVALSSYGQTAKNVKTIEPAAFAEKIAATQNAQILDVRTPEEYTSGHIDNAANINWNGNDFVVKATTFDKTKPIFVYCKSGGRSKQAVVKLEELGFASIYELQGGMLKWDAAGFSKPSDKIIGMCPQEYGDLLNTDKKVLIDFYADWCAPCKKMTPYLLQMQKDPANKVTIIRLNADENKTMMTELKIDELPALLLYENKQIIWKHSGYISEEELNKQLQ